MVGEEIAIFKELFGSYQIVYIILFGFILLFSRFMIKEYRINIWKKFSLSDKLSLSLIIGFIALSGVTIFVPFIMLVKGEFNIDTPYSSDIIDYTSTIFFTFLYGLTFIFIKIDTKKPTSIVKKYFLLTFTLIFMVMTFLVNIFGVKKILEGETGYIFGLILIGLPLLLITFKYLTKFVFDCFGKKLPLYKMFYEKKARGNIK